MSKWGSFTFATCTSHASLVVENEWKPHPDPRSDQLLCNINIFLVVSETATPWHGVSISNCTQQATPGVLGIGHHVGQQKTQQCCRSDHVWVPWQTVLDVWDLLSIATLEYRCEQGIDDSNLTYTVYTLSFKLPDWLHELQGCWVCSCVPTGKKTQTLPPKIEANLVD